MKRFVANTPGKGRVFVCYAHDFEGACALFARFSIDPLWVHEESEEEGREWEARTCASMSDGRVTS